MEIKANGGGPTHNAVVLYHKNCIDGFCAAWVAQMFLGNNADYVPINYGEPLPFLEDRVIYFVDFSVKRDVLLDLLARNKHIVVLDHHKTALEEIGPPLSSPHPNLHITFDMERSGAGITWDYFSGMTHRPWLVDYVEDRDLWRWALPESKEVHAYISTIPFKFEAWSRVHGTISVDRAAELGKSVLARIHQYNEATMKNIVLMDLFGYLNVPTINAAYMGISELLNEVIVKTCSTFSVGWALRADGKLQFSLRSVGDFDVSEIAKRFGGGGHRNAAGFELSFSVGVEMLQNAMYTQRLFTKE